MTTEGPTIKAIMGDPSHDHIDPNHNGTDEHQIRWIKPHPRGNPTVTINLKGELMMSAALLNRFQGDPTNPLHVRVGVLDTGELCIEKCGPKDPYARKVYKNGVFTGVIIREIEDVGFTVQTRYLATVNRQGTQALIKSTDVQGGRR